MPTHDRAPSYVTDRNCQVCGRGGSTVVQVREVQLLMSTALRCAVEDRYGEEFFNWARNKARNTWDSLRSVDRVCLGCAENHITSSIRGPLAHGYFRDVVSQQMRACCDCGCSDSVDVRCSLRMAHHSVILDSINVEVQEEGGISQCEVSGDNLCASCLSAREYCPNCGMACREESLMPEGSGCLECVPVFHTVRSWNYTPSQFVVHTTGKSDDKQTYGMEFEVHVGPEVRRDMCAHMFYAHIDDAGLRPAVYMKHDGSIEPGFEIVTMPMTHEFMQKSKAIETIYAALETVNAEVLSHTRNHAACGIHIHMGREGTPRTSFAKMAALLYGHPTFTEHIGRRTANSYCRTDAPGSVVGALTRRGWGARYQAVNFENEATVEFRHMRNTGLVQDALLYADSLVAMRTWAKQASLRDRLADFGEYADKQKGTTWAYLAEAARVHADTSYAEVLTRKWRPLSMLTRTADRVPLPPRFREDSEGVLWDGSHPCSVHVARVLREVYIMPSEDVTRPEVPEEAPLWARMIDEYELRQGRR